MGLIFSVPSIPVLYQQTQAELEVEAQSYRLQIKNNKNNNDSMAEAIVNLGTCLSEGAVLALNDLVGTKFENRFSQNLLTIDRIDIAATLYRKALGFNPESTLALYNLALCFEEGATLEESDFPKTLFRLTRNELIIALYRQILTMDPTHRQARDNLAYCLSKIGAILIKDMSQAGEAKKLSDREKDSMLKTVFTKKSVKV